MSRIGLLAVLGLLLVQNIGSAFNGHLVREGALVVSIEEIPAVTNLDQVLPFTVLLTNRGDQPLEVALHMGGLVDETRAVGNTNQVVNVAAGSSGSARFCFAMGQGSHSALYPVHIFASFKEGSSNHTAHAIRIFEAQFPPATTGRVQVKGVLASGGLLPLNSTLAPEITVQVKDPIALRPGFRGSEPRTGASFDYTSVNRGEERFALTMHPPYKGGAGTLFASYKVRLPEGPSAFYFYNAIRDHTKTEPPSDGVTFRVYVEGEQLFEQHTSSKQWVPGKVDLSRWAGREITLRLETHPGPKMDTTCDSGFWGDPVLLSGSVGDAPDAKAHEERLARAEAMATGLSSDKRAITFGLRDGMKAVLVPGPAGLADAALAFAGENRVVVIDGFRLAFRGQTLADWPSGARVRSVDQRTVEGRVFIDHKVHLAPGVGGQGTTAVLRAELWVERGALKIKFSSDEEITDLAPGKTTQRPSRVYFGHGYAIDRPGRFRAHGGGHDLATSHTACEYDSGLTLLSAVDTPPDFLEVDGAQNICSLHTHPDATFTFLPGVKGGLETALRFRALSEKRPAPAFRRKAGRFVFDIWGGRYANDTGLLRRCFSYGLTNSIAVMHVWQRWGYDYRLPDIFPPDPGLGSLDDLKGLGEACNAVGALWGVHDNYIDLYPDADDFSYEHVTFDSAGHPREAWLNEGRDAQSYQFRPDHVRPFLDRNLRLIQPALKPTTSFVDVWTSMNVFDYYDRQGGFHSRTETRRLWGEGFARIREVFGGAPTMSEAGSDQLIGWLDGADCQFLRISSSGEQFCFDFPCGDWERVPWFDAVHHRRFSLHGVGYSNRYQGGRSREQHGIESDDYLSAEMLTGHALMIDLPGMVRGAVRKYWLAQEFIESIAHDDIESVAFADGDMHRQIVRWKSGAQVWVNRSAEDWQVAGTTLPQFGFMARNGAIESRIERLNGQVVEQSTGKSGRYVNARAAEPNAPLAIRPQALSVTHAGGRRFKLEVKWDAAQPAPKDLAVFYHFKRRVPGRYTEQEFYSGGMPKIPTSQWTGEVRTGGDWEVSVPDDFPSGEYQVLVGLYDHRSNGPRYRLMGDERADRRYYLGTLVLEGENKRPFTGVRLINLAETAEAPRLVLPRAAQFGPVQTAGGLKLIKQPGSTLVLPLPDGPAFDVELDLPSAVGRQVEPAGLKIVDEQGTVKGNQPFEKLGTQIRWKTRPGDFGYRMEYAGQ